MTAANYLRSRVKAMPSAIRRVCSTTKAKYICRIRQLQYSGDKVVVFHLKTSKKCIASQILTVTPQTVVSSQ